MSEECAGPQSGHGRPEYAVSTQPVSSSNSLANDLGAPLVRRMVGGGEEAILKTEQETIREFRLSLGECVVWFLMGLGIGLIVCAFLL